MALERPPEPWHSLFVDIESVLEQRVELHCLGGFVISMLYGMPRPTADIDYIAVAPHRQIVVIEKTAGRGSPLHLRHGVYLQHVGLVTVPENYSDRLIAMFPGAYSKQRVFGLEAHDLALSKLERNAARDREDVKFLARVVPLDLELLEARYRNELRPYLASPERHDLTLRLWHDAILGR